MIISLLKTLLRPKRLILLAIILAALAYWLYSSQKAEDVTETKGVQTTYALSEDETAAIPTPTPSPTPTNSTTNYSNNQPEAAETDPVSTPIPTPSPTPSAEPTPDPINTYSPVPTDEDVI
jgi:cytoskeletal protein RodZ